MNYNDISEYLKFKQEDFNKLLLALVSMQSYSKEKDNINKLHDFVADTFSQFSPDIERISTPVGDLQILSFFAGKPDFAVLLAHIDTVRVSEDFILPIIKEGRLYGSGAYDMKNAIAMFYFVLDCLEHFKIKSNKTIKLILTPDEEIGSENSTKIIIENTLKAKAVIIPEPCGPNGTVKIRRKGIALLNAIITGKSAHSGIEPQAGADANKALISLLNQINIILQKYPDIYFNPGIISGGVKVNVVSPESFLDSEMRSFNEKNLKKALKEIEQLEQKGNINIRIFAELSRRPMQFTKENELLYEKAKSIADKLDYSLGKYETGGSSDGASLAPLGIPVIDGMGLQGNGAHSLDEYVDLSDFHKRTAIITGLFLES